VSSTRYDLVLWKGWPYSLEVDEREYACEPHAHELWPLTNYGALTGWVYCRWCCSIVVDECGESIVDFDVELDSPVQWTKPMKEAR
jgi:hypothetical protein